MQIELRHVDIALGGPPLLDDANLVVEQGRRMCVLGRNGSGKSTLLRLLAGDIAPDDGIVTTAPGLRVGYLAQEATSGTSNERRTALEIVRSPDDAGDVATLKMLDRLGVDPDAVFRDLSGGLKRRALLARAMSKNPDVLLLDEPTNHLDPDMIEWLEKWLAKPGLTMVFVSHDRRFITNVADEIVELDRGRLYHGRMGYKRYLEQRESRLRDEESDLARFEKQLGEEEKWIRTGIKARRTRNEGRVRRLEKMRERQRNYRRSEGRVQMQTQEADASGRLVLELSGVNFSFGRQPILRNVDMRVMRGDRIGFIGANGSGKTTLLRVMLGQLQPDSGTVRHGTRLLTAEFDQHRATLDESMTLMDNVADGREFVSVAGAERHIIGYLKDFLFTPEQARAPIRRLSGGERARVMLARLFSRPFNLLVMDEPTNDLDIETLELLEELLMDYKGTLLLVSHDREFLDNVTTSIVHLDGTGRAVEYGGGYSEYRRVQQAATDLGQSARSPQARDEGRSPPPAKLSYKLQRELENLPGEIESLESSIANLHEMMSEARFYERSAEEIATANRELAEYEATLAQRYARWEELEAMRDA
jgi:ATP-binding cassette subfamily F protein uup